MRFFRLSGPLGPWGDYGTILVHGMSAHLPREAGLLQLERTGPWVPPISFPGFSVVLTDATRTAFEALAFSGAAYKPVVKRHIARLDWRSWPLDEPQPPEYPSEGEPENYILDRPHDPGLAESLGDLWELDLAEHAQSVRGDLGEVLIRQDSWDGTDFFRLGGTRINVATDRAVEWLVETFPDCVAAQELELV